MRCEEFDPEEYVMKLIHIALEEESRLSALEYYLHCDTCPRDRERFEKFVNDNFQPTNDEYHLIYEGLKIVGEASWDE